MLIENLHLIQDFFSGLKSRHLVALASEMKMPMAAVFEVASFYHHFDLIQDSDTTPKITVRVCEGISCELAGSKKLFSELSQSVQSDIRVIKAATHKAVKPIFHKKSFNSKPNLTIKIERLTI